MRISYDFSGLTPLYLLAGGREVKRGMIVDFAQEQAQFGADVMLDRWPDIAHNFPAYDSLKTSSTEALARICEMILAAGTSAPWARPLPAVSRVVSGHFGPKE